MLQKWFQGVGICNKSIKTPNIPKETRGRGQSVASIVCLRWRWAQGCARFQGNSHRLRPHIALEVGTSCYTVVRIRVPTRAHGVDNVRGNLSFLPTGCKHNDTFNAYRHYYNIIIWMTAFKTNCSSTVKAMAVAYDYTTKSPMTKSPDENPPRLNPRNVLY